MNINLNLCFYIVDSSLTMNSPNTSTDLRERILSGEIPPSLLAIAWRLVLLDQKVSDAFVITPPKKSMFSFAKK